MPRAACRTSHIRTTCFCHNECGKDGRQTWLINYAARNSWVFDFIFWRFLDSGCFGHNERGEHCARLNLLAEDELAAMENFVKMEELKTRALVGWDKSDDDSAVVRVIKVMI